MRVNTYMGLQAVLLVLIMAKVLLLTVLAAFGSPSTTLVVVLGGLSLVQLTAVSAITIRFLQLLFQGEK